MDCVLEWWVNFQFKDRCAACRTSGPQGNFSDWGVVRLKVSLLDVG
jgi:hypothetical protein